LEAGQIRRRQQNGCGQVGDLAFLLKAVGQAFEGALGKSQTAYEQAEQQEDWYANTHLFMGV